MDRRALNNNNVLMVLIYNVTGCKEGALIGDSDRRSHV